jgi:methylated-DNA-[protein]-cysteine S-methyltransferase
MMQAQTFYCHMDSPIARLTAIASEEGLHGLHMQAGKYEPLIKSEWIFNARFDLFVTLQMQLHEYFASARTQFDIPLAPAGTLFQKRVWQALVDIPFGKTCSYSEIALKLGDINAVRAVAAANGLNPIAIIIPCHRVIGKDGSLTGYAGGLARKQQLLALEQKLSAGQLNLW